MFTEIMRCACDIWICDQSLCHIKHSHKRKDQFFIITIAIHRDPELLICGSVCRPLETIGDMDLMRNHGALQHLFCFWHNGKYDPRIDEGQRRLIEESDFCHNLHSTFPVYRNWYKLNIAIFMYLISDSLNLSSSIYFPTQDEFCKINEPLYFNTFDVNMLVVACLRW